MKNKKNGRPVKITAAVVRQVGELMALGLPEDFACARFGVNPATFGPVVSRSPAFKGMMKVQHAAFMERALRAIADGGEMGTMMDADGKSRDVRKPWQGLAFILERRHKPHFNRTDTHAMTDTGGEGMAFSEAMLLDLERLAKESFVRS